MLMPHRSSEACEPEPSQPAPLTAGKLGHWGAVHTMQLGLLREGAAPSSADKPKGICLPSFQTCWFERHEKIV